MAESRKPKTLFITPSYLPAVGGAERQLALLGAALRERGHAVDILTHREADLPRREETPSGTVWRVLRVPKSPRLYGTTVVLGTLWWLVRHGRRYDVVQCMFLSVHAVACAVLAPFFAWRWGARLACAGRFGELGVFPTGTRRRIVRWALNRAHWLVALAAESAREMREFGLAPERIHVLPNAVDTERFSCPERSYARAERLLFVGRLTEQKNLPALLEALATPSLGNCRLTLAGTGPLQAVLADSATRLGIAERVQFRGPVPPEAMPQLYCDHDIFVLPSLAEGMSNALLEAMAAGMVCVCTPVGGAPDLVRDGENGVLATVSDSGGLQGALRRAMTLSSGERGRIGRTARKTVIQRCSVAAVLPRLAGLFTGADATESPDAIIHTAPAGNTAAEIYGDEFVGKQNRWFREGLESPDAGYGPRIRRLLDAMGTVTEGIHVLDLGCGIGTFAIVLAQRGAVTVGLDLSPEAIAAARENACRLGVEDETAFVQGDATASETFPPDTFDLIVGADIVEHLPPPILEATLRNCYRWIKPGGSLFIHTYPTRYYYLLSSFDRVLHVLVRPLYILPVRFGRTYLELLHHVIVPALYWLRFDETYEQQIARTGHCNPPHPEEFRRLLQKAGFEVEFYETTDEILTGLSGDQPRHLDFHRLIKRINLLKPAIIAKVRKPRST